jgi:hypothetical protein
LTQPRQSRGRADHPAAANGRGILLLVVAFIIGIGILKSTENGSGSAASISTGTQTATTRHSTTPATEIPGSTVPPPRAPSEVKVLPVNASGVAGIGGKTGDKLRSNGYANTLAAVNSTSDSPSATTTVAYAPTAAADAVLVAGVLGLQPAAVVKPLENPPVAQDELRGADVVVIIGTDLAAIVGGGTTSTTSG